MTTAAADSHAAPSTRRQISDDQLRRMIGQMVLVGFVGDNPEAEGYRLVMKQAEKGQITGIILLKRNIQSMPSVQALNAGLQSASKVPLLISIDQEGGRIERLTSVIGFRETASAEKIARSMSETKAFKIYREMAGSLHNLGFNLNFGPVVDVNINPQNPIIGRLGRSFSADPQKVINYAMAFIKAHNEAHVLTALKHFPGHGSSKRDSHKGSADVTATWNESELEPYEIIIGLNEADMVMSSHVINGKLAGSRMPSSLSAEILKKLLRGKLQFKGVVISDDMQMEAIASNYGFEDSVVKAVLAGNDILVFANDKHPDPLIPEKIADLLVKEAKTNPQMLSRIRDASTNIARLKKKIARSEKARLLASPLPVAEKKRDALDAAPQND
jgi:beta-N-acetylhexosaminidase